MKDMKDLTDLSPRLLPDLSPLLPADELGLLRAELRRLKAREAVLRQALLGDPLACAGRAFHATVRVQTQRVFLRDRLPPAILDDPALWTQRRTRQLLVTPVGAGQGEAGQSRKAQARDGQAPRPALAPVSPDRTRDVPPFEAEDDEGFDVIEPF